MRYDGDVKTYMKTKDAIKVAREVFSTEPVISRIEANFLTVRDETNYIDLTIFFDGERSEGDSRIVKLAIEFMKRVQDVPVEFNTLPISMAEKSHAGTLVYSRDNEA